MPSAINNSYYGLPLRRTFAKTLVKDSVLTNALFAMLDTANLPLKRLAKASTADNLFFKSATRSRSAVVISFRDTPLA